MFLRIIISSIFLPLVVASMIIAQIHLENYQIDIKKRHPERKWSNFYIVFIYLAQEICIMELTLLNIDITAFTVVIPITMILRNKNKIWWWLLGLTPFIAVIMNICLKRYEFVNWGTNLLQLALTATICFILLNWNKPPYYIKYTIALYTNFLIHVLVLTIEHHLQLDFVISILLGNCFIILIETSRHHYEIKQKEEIAKLHYESIRDDLTGLLNYRAFDQDMRDLAQEEDPTPILIAILDIDHFKKVNDTYGHLNGNIVLHAFSEKIKSEVHHNFDPDCAVYRFGGEEFTIVVKNQSYAKLIDLLRKINKHFSSNPVKTHDGRKISFSFSGGLTKHIKGETYTQTLARADTLVYQAKNSGRKKVLFD